MFRAEACAIMTFMSLPSKPTARASLRVIAGGRATQPTAISGGYRHSGRTLPGQVEEDRLRAAILALPVPDTGLTVEQALDEICSVLHDEVLDKIERGAFLCNALEVLGVRFQMANPDLGLAREGFLNLVWPDRLLSEHPELAGLHPTAHPYMLLG